MNLKWIFSLLLAGVFLMNSCDDPDPVVIDRGEEYFPLRQGMLLEYKVDSVIFDDASSGNSLDTFTAFIRERVVEASVNPQGDSVFQILREHRRQTNVPWQVTDLLTISRSALEIVRVENNQQLLKMAFPLFEDRGWNPTKYINTLITIPVGTEVINMFSFWDGEVISMDQAEQIGEFTFDEVMTCYQADDDNELERRYVLEKYAKGIGLVFRSDTIVDSRCERLGDFGPCIGQNWLQKGEKGYILRMELINHN